MGMGRAALLGAVAGAAGTAAMDALWYWRYRRGGGTQGVVGWETADGTTSYKDASAPARTAQLAAKKLGGVDLPDSSARAATNLVHWSTGAAWGGAYGVVRELLPEAYRPVWAVGFGPVVWTQSYAVLGVLGIYEPIWTYSAKVLWQDLSAHLAYGLTTAATYELLDR